MDPHFVFFKTLEETLQSASQQLWSAPFVMFSFYCHDYNLAADWIIIQAGDLTLVPAYLHILIMFLADILFTVYCH